MQKVIHLSTYLNGQIIKFNAIIKILSLIEIAVFNAKRNNECTFMTLCNGTKQSATAAGNQNR